jgi:hypothetical protein
MCADQVVFSPPVIKDLAHLLKGTEQISIKDIFTERPDEALNVDILSWLSRLNMGKSNIMILD